MDGLLVRRPVQRLPVMNSRKEELMRKIFIRLLGIYFLLTMLIMPSLSFAKDCEAGPIPDDLTTNTAIHVGSVGNWYVFIDSNPTQCWMMATPSKSKLSLDKQRSDICRNDPYFMVNFVPSRNIYAQLSYFSGFELEEGSKVQILSGDMKFDLETLDGQMAWTKNSREDGYLFGSIIENRHIVIGARSASGAVTVDTFDMKGILGAFQKATSLCSSAERTLESNWPHNSHYSKTVYQKIFARLNQSF